MPVWVYPAKGPKYLVTEKVSRGSDPVMSLPFQERMQKTLYQMECEQGSKFKVPGYSKATLKKAWWDMKVRE